MIRSLARRPIRNLRPTFLMFAVAAVCLAISSLAAGEDLADQIDAHLATGEFPVALDLAAAAPADQRDALLERIAAAQNAAGARRAADATIARINDDRLRAGAVDHILAQRFGPVDPALAQFGGGGGGGGQQGGGSAADFDAIMELITRTIEPDSWDEVGGPGSIAPFEGGVVVDAAGVLRRTEQTAGGSTLARLRREALRGSDNRAARTSSTLRKVSLTRLEKAIQLKLAAGLKPDSEMQVLAGLTRITHVFVYPETGDLVIAGPAGDWHRADDGRIVNVESGRPVVRLDDLVVVLRSVSGDPADRFGCSITPRTEALAATKAYLAATSKKPLPPGRAAREKWLEGIRSAMGRQNIEVYGVDPATRVANVLVEADYHMKLIGMGLEKGTDGVTSYLDSVRLQKGQAAPPLDVLRWWFTLNYDAVGATPDHHAFEIRGQGVQVLSENEMLTQLGERIHTGKSDELNSLFAQTFTREFAALSAKYPIYVELQNIFDLALVAAICDKYDLPAMVQWHMTCLGNSSRFAVAGYPVARQVDSVINHRLVNGNQIIAGVSGGVRVDPGRVLAAKRPSADRAATVAYQRKTSRPVKTPEDRWWWD